MRAKILGLLTVGLLAGPMVANANDSFHTGNPRYLVPVTPAPEIDAASAAGGLTLLLGGLVVLRGRRQADRVVV